MFRQAVSIALLVLLPLTAGATTFSRKKVEDPVTGGTCYVDSMNAFGSHGYRYESSRDHVYAHQMQVWSCPSGYVSFEQDFDELSEAERTEVRRYLAFQPKLYATEEEREERRLARRKELESEDLEKLFGFRLSEERLAEFIRVAAEGKKWGERFDSDEDRARHANAELDRLEALYRIRDKDDGFWAWFYRVLAYRYSRSDPDRADGYRARALPLVLEEIEKGEASGHHLAGLHYVAGDYALRGGDRELAARMFDAAAAVAWIDRDGKLKRGFQPFNGYIVERRIKMRSSGPFK